MSNESPSRRELLRNAAIAALLGSVPAEAAQHVHQQATQEKKTAGAYKPKGLNPQEYRTVQRLAELIVPADEVSGSALEAGAPEFIDLLCSQNEELLAIYTGGLSWLDREMQKRYGALFTASKPAEQTAMLDLIAYRKNDGPELGPGIVFFDWVRKMVVDAFYTSPIGWKDVGFTGNKGMSTFQVPKEALEYALKRSAV
jgi:hypothetical protein